MLADPGGGGAFEGISAAVGGIVEAADAGFTISESGGQPLLKAIDDLATEVATALGQGHMLAKEPALGSTPAATVYKPFLSTVASDQTQGAIPVLTKLHADLASAHAAIQKAMDNYQDTDHGNASNVQSTGTWV
jgi:hypothetical protein